MTAFAIDATELFHNPVRSGIQRVVRELLRHWPGDRPFPTVVHFEDGQLLHLSRAVVDLLSGRDSEGGRLAYEALRQRVIGLARETPLEVFPDDGTVFIPEVFFDPARCVFYEERLARFPDSVAMLFFDLLPYLRSDLFQFTSLLPYMHYARLARMAPHAAFISDQTRREYSERLLHRRGEALADLKRIGPVLPLGTDGLALERQAWAQQRRLFASIGSVDGRKNQHLIVEGFVRLWKAGHEIPLVLVGGAFEGMDVARIEAASGYKQFRWMRSATDEDIAGVLREARATIYASESEGYGLPPVESLAAGIPVIASKRIPSLAMLPAAGQIRLDEVTPDAIAEAVLAMQPNEAARALWQGAASLELGTWAGFAADAAAWCAGLGRTKAEPWSRA